MIATGWMVRQTFSPGVKLLPVATNVCDGCLTAASTVAVGGWISLLTSAGLEAFPAASKASTRIVTAPRTESGVGQNHFPSSTAASHNDPPSASVTTTLVTSAPTVPAIITWFATSTTGEPGATVSTVTGTAIACGIAPLPSECNTVKVTEPSSNA